MAPAVAEQVRAVRAAAAQAGAAVRAAGEVCGKPASRVRPQVLAARAALEALEGEGQELAGPEAEDLAVETVRAVVVPAAVAEKEVAEGLGAEAVVV